MKMVKKKIKHAIPIVSVKIDAMHRQDGDQFIPIGPDEYMHRKNYFPSRNQLILNHDGSRSPFLVVETVPPKPNRGGGKRKGNRPGNDPGQSQDWKCERHENILCEYNPTTKTFRLNVFHKWVYEYFQNRSGLEKLATELYERLREFAECLYAGYPMFAIQGTDETKIPECYDDKVSPDEIWDCHINQFLISILERPVISAITDQMDKKIGKMVEVNVE
jgi:hypothetical protein